MGDIPRGEPESPMGRGGLKQASSHVLTLSEDECWGLLRQGALGRVALVINGRPRIFPVNYAAGEGSIVFRTEPGAKLEHGPGSPACFEIDGYDRNGTVGWSVMVAGVLEDITDSDDERSLRLRRLAVDPVAPGARLHWLALQAEEVSGRSFQGGWSMPVGSASVRAAPEGLGDDRKDK
jgi:uncharacterized protein